MQNYIYFYKPGKIIIQIKLRMERITKIFTQKIPIKSPENHDLSEIFDIEFPPEIKSLVNPTKINDFQEFLSYKWKRFSEIHSKTALFPTKFSQINQGSLGDCYFLCAINAISKYPKILSQIFCQDESVKTETLENWYKISCYILGKKRIIWLDDYFPYNLNTNQFSFAKPYENAAYVLLLEKAWAKINGCYANIESGIGVEALKFLTGAPCKDIIHELYENKEELWHILLESFNKNLIMTCSAVSKESIEIYKENGLIKNHSYSIVKIKEVIDKNGISQKIIKLQNPWGENKDTKIKLNLTFSQYLRFFESTAICMYYPNYLHTNIQINSQSKTGFEFEIFDKMHCIIEVCTFSKRIFRNDYPNYKPPTIGLIIGKFNPSIKKYQFISSIGKSGGLMGNIDIELEKGKYIIFVYANYFSLNARNFAIDFYAEKKIFYREIGWNNDIFIDIFKQYSNSKIFERKENDLIIYKQADFLYGFGLIFIKNNSEENIYELDLKISLQGLEMLYPENTAKTTKNKLRKYEENIYVMKIINEEIIGISLEYAKMVI